MLSCEQFQLLAGADPRHLTWGQRLHRMMCRTCSRYLDTMQDLDHKIENVLEGELPEDPRLPPR